MASSIRRKITVSYILLFVFLFGLLGALLSGYFFRVYQTNLEQTLLNEAQLMARISSSLIWEGLTDFSSEVSETLELRVTVIDSEGNPVAETYKPVDELENHLSRPEMQRALAGEAATSTRYSSTLASEVLYAAAPIYNAGNEIVGVFRLATPLTTIKNTLSAIRNGLLGAIVVGGLLFWLVGSLLAGRITSSLARLRQKAREIGKGVFSDQKTVISGDEVAELDLVFNEMSINIQKMITAANRERTRLEEIITNLPVGIIVLNQQGVVLAVNVIAQNMLDTGLGGVNKPFFQLTRESQINQFVNQVLGGERPQQTELILERPQGGKLFIRLHGAGVIRDSQGKNEEVVIVLQDITDLRRLEQQRRDLVANVSHELRTPLTAIQGFAETLLESDDDLARNTRFLEIIRDESVRLSRLINDLLNLSRLESGHRRKSGEVEIKSVADSVVNLLSSQADARNQTLQVAVRSGIFVALDADYLEQIIMNYLENAIKYTPENTVIKIEADVLDNNFVRVAVIDSGPGIPPEEQHRLFERFFRVEKSRQRQSGGTGLGLAIVKHIVDGVGGQVGVISNQITGTSFWATLPLAKKHS
ncbi:MAG: PAS domain-containing protein [Firmicutes bacterium]|nr:PAS domain-containing protein [Bacillota bacterium]